MKLIKIALSFVLLFVFAISSFALDVGKIDKFKTNIGAEKVSTVQADKVQTVQTNAAYVVTNLKEPVFRDESEPNYVFDGFASTKIFENKTPFSKIDYPSRS